MEFKLIIKKINNNLNPEERNIFDKWYESSNEHRKYFDNVQNNLNKSIDFVDVERAWNELNEKLNARDSVESTKKTMIWKYVAVAAIFALISSPFVFLKKSNFSNIEIVEKVKETNVLSPNKVILTLENGDNIALEKGKNYSLTDRTINGEKLVYNSDNKNTTIQYNYLTIPKGHEFFLQLSDGTKIWLNSESKLKYPVKFIEGETRTVELAYGEAYFDVSPSENHQGTHFKVESQGQNIEVLGTEFNIKSYKDSPKHYTTLVEGKVLISDNRTSRILKPGQQSVVNDEVEGVKVKNVDVLHEVAWKNGFFSFKKESLDEILITFARWYDIKVTYENKAKKDEVFSGVLRRTEHIEELLKNLEKTGKLKFEIKNKEVIVK